MDSTYSYEYCFPKNETTGHSNFDNLYYTSDGLINKTC